ncbi:MAG TPA: UvrD-helicase domain-containing protein [Candidatus Paceibacterota bacterium]
MTDRVNYLTELNEAQRRAVLHRDGPLLVIAGAGAGKTKTITSRVLHLIKNGVEPKAILAITFTNKAAKEMLNRVSALLEHEPGLGPSEGRPFISTFHTLGVHLLREHGRVLDIPRQFSIADRDDSLAMIKAALQDLGYDPKAIEPRRILSTISREKGRLVSASHYTEHLESNYFGQIIVEVWRRYEAALQASHSLDFDDLILKVVELLRQEPQVLSLCQARWLYLHIDEYQDTNVAQYELCHLLTGAGENICAVGDLDQSIYSWRGADFKNLLRFEHDFPRATVVTLEENYRSTQTILEAANRIIKKNVNRLEKTLYTKNQRGEKITLIVALDEEEEATLIAGTAKRLIEGGARAEEIAVLYRANFQSRALEKAMLQANVPYRVLGTRFFERQEVKDLLAYLKAALNPHDFTSRRRIINVPPRGLGKVTVVKVLAGDSASLPLKTRERVVAFDALLLDIRVVAVKEKPSTTIRYVLDHSGLGETLRQGGSDDLERLENLRELVTLSLAYDHEPGEAGISALLTEAALVSDQDTLSSEVSAVSLMTVHAAKGLEFDHVFVAGLEQDLFPHARLASQSAGGEEIDTEEERRLFYVALTRARQKLYLSYAEMRTIFGGSRMTTPSDFLLDLDDTLIEPLGEETTSTIEIE